jgi:hypothetical protein
MPAAANPPNVRLEGGNVPWAASVASESTTVMTAVSRGPAGVNGIIDTSEGGT